MGESNLNPNIILLAYTNTQLYLQVVNYGPATVNMIETWTMTSISKVELVCNFIKQSIKANHAKNILDRKKPCLRMVEVLEGENINPKWITL